MSTSNIRAGVALTGALSLAAGTAAVAANPMVGGAAMYPTKNIVQNAVNSKDHTTLVAAVKAGGPGRHAVGQGAVHRLRADQRGLRQAARRHGRHAGQAREQGDARPRS